MNCKIKKAALLFLCLTVITGLLPFSKVKGEEASFPEFICLNVGKGDCLLLLAEEQAYLIDAGYEQTYPLLKTTLNELGVTHLDGVFLTHTHKDHSGGLMPLSKDAGITVSKWYAPDIFYDEKAEDHPMVLAAKERNEQVTWLHAGNIISLSENTFFKVLGPLTVNTENENNNSLVMEFVSPHGSILLTGDMKEEEESELLSRHLFSPCTVLKVAHHGDNHTSTPRFLNTVQPEIALIPTSTFEEPDTPAAEVIQGLRSRNCRVLVTQNEDIGYAVTLQNGHADYKSVVWENVPAKIKSIDLSIDLDEDVIIIANRSVDSVYFHGTCLLSKKGNDLFYLPDFSLDAGQSFKIGSLDTDIPCDYILESKRIWHKKKRDIAVFYDDKGRILAYADNGKKE